jgi:hypothetical protein
MITDETIREYEAQLEAEWAELDEQFYDALEQGYLPGVEKIQAEMQKVSAKLTAVHELINIETDRLRKSA